MCYNYTLDPIAADNAHVFWTQDHESFADDPMFIIADDVAVLAGGIRPFDRCSPRFGGPLPVRAFVPGALRGSASLRGRRPLSHRKHPLRTFCRFSGLPARIPGGTVLLRSRIYIFFDVSVGGAEVHGFVPTDKP